MGLNSNTILLGLWPYAIFSLGGGFEHLSLFTSKKWEDEPIGEKSPTRFIFSYEPPMISHGRPTSANLGGFYGSNHGMIPGAGPTELLQRLLEASPLALRGSSTLSAALVKASSVQNRGTTRDL